MLIVLLLIGLLIFYRPILYLYKFNKSYLKYASLLVTPKFTLKCEKCASLIPYSKSSKHYGVGELKNNIDFVTKWIITGGESFIYPNPNIKELVDYVGEHY